MEQRRYLCQNWRADVSAILNDDGSEQIESIKYFSYGYSINIPAGDVDSDGDTDSDDTTEINKWRLATPVVYRVRADLNLDGVLDASDETLCQGLETTVGGRGVLSRTDTANRKGYAGYESDATADADGSRFWHVRHRVLDSTLGRWTRRDPAGYVDGMNSYRLGRGQPVTRIDANGLCSARQPELCAVAIDDQMLPWRPGHVPSRKEIDEMRTLSPPALTPFEFCCQWRRRQLNPGTWSAGLPSCPRSIPNSGNPDSAIWRDPTPADDYHPGASRCMRSAPASNGAGQQCCYDHFDRLITDGPGAGTPDLYAPEGPIGIIRHYIEDVRSFSACEQAGCVATYLEGRPPNRGNGCPINYQGDDPMRSCLCGIA